MVVRENTIIQLDEYKSVNLPVSCVNFYKSVPTSFDSSDATGDSDPLIKALLAVASAAEIDSFVTQLAVWVATDRVAPQRVSIKVVAWVGRRRGIHPQLRL